MQQQQDSASRIEAAKRGIEHQAQECVEALQLARFAEDQPSLGDDIAHGLRKLAEYHSDHAFRWATALAKAVAA